MLLRHDGIVSPQRGRELALTFCGSKPLISSGQSHIKCHTERNRLGNQGLSEALVTWGGSHPAAQTVEQPLHVGRQWRGKLDSLEGDRMVDREAGGMQRLPLDEGGLRVCA